MCIHVPSNNWEKTRNFDGESKGVVIFENTSVSACSRKSSICEDRFVRLCLLFVQDFETSMDDWKPGINDNSIMNLCVVSEGTYEVCSRAIAQKSDNAEWLISVQSQMEGACIHLDVSVGGQLSALDHTLTMLTSFKEDVTNIFVVDDESNDGNQPENSSSQESIINNKSKNCTRSLPVFVFDSLLDAKNRLKLIEKGMNEQLKIFNHFRSFGAPHGTIEHEIKLIHELKAVVFKNFSRGDMIQKLRRQSVEASGIELCNNDSYNCGNSKANAYRSRSFIAPSPRSEQHQMESPEELNVDSRNSLNSASYVSNLRSNSPNHSTSLRIRSGLVSGPPRETFSDTQTMSCRRQSSLPSANSDLSLSESELKWRSGTIEIEGERVKLSKKYCDVCCSSSYDSMEIDNVPLLDSYGHGEQTSTTSLPRIFIQKPQEHNIDFELDVKVLINSEKCVLHIKDQIYEDESKLLTFIQRQQKKKSIVHTITNSIGQQQEQHARHQLMTTVCCLSRSVLFSPQLKSLQEWFHYAFANSEIDGCKNDVHRFPCVKRERTESSCDGNNTSCGRSTSSTSRKLQDHPHAREVIFSLSSLQLHLKTEHLQTSRTPGVINEKPLVDCRFISEFEDHIFVTVDGEAFFFLHDLISSYVSEKGRVHTMQSTAGNARAQSSNSQEQKTINIDVSNATSTKATNTSVFSEDEKKRKQFNPAKIFLKDWRSYRCKTWNLKPTLRLLSCAGKSIEPYGIDYISRELDFSHARTIPKWIQRKFMDPLDKIFTVLVLTMVIAAREEIHGDKENRYRCNGKQTYGCNVVLTRYPDGRIELSGGTHEHPNSTIQIREPAIQEMKQLADNFCLQPSNIISRVNKAFPLAGEITTPEAARQRIWRKRRGQLPVIPSEFEVLKDVLVDLSVAQNTYIGHFKASDNSYGYVFSNNTLLKILGESKEIFIDGTFKSRPKQPKCSQLLIVHVRKNDVGIPVLFVLCQRRTTQFYKAFWEDLIKRLPNLETTLQIIVMDYERALLRATRECFPNALIRGCWIHFIRAVSRYWRGLHLPRTDETNKILSMVWAVPLLKPKYFETALNDILDEMKLRMADTPAYLLFNDYLQHTWLPIASTVSVYKSAVRTNNFAEGFNRFFGKNMGCNPDLITFLVKLDDIIQDAVMRCQQLNKSLLINKKRKIVQMVKDSRVTYCIEMFRHGNWSVKEFLETVFSDHMRTSEMDFIINLKNYSDERYQDLDIPQQLLKDPSHVPQRRIEGDLSLERFISKNKLRLIKPLNGSNQYSPLRNSDSCSCSDTSSSSESLVVSKRKVLRKRRRNIIPTDSSTEEEAPENFKHVVEIYEKKKPTDNVSRPKPFSKKKKLCASNIDFNAIVVLHDIVDNDVVPEVEVDETRDLQQNIHSPGRSSIICISSDCEDNLDEISTHSNTTVHDDKLLNVEFPEERDLLQNHTYPGRIPFTINKNSAKDSNGLCAKDTNELNDAFHDDDVPGVEDHEAKNQQQYVSSPESSSNMMISSDSEEVNIHSPGRSSIICISSDCEDNLDEISTHVSNADHDCRFPDIVQQKKKNESLSPQYTPLNYLCIKYEDMDNDSDSTFFDGDVPVL